MDKLRFVVDNFYLRIGFCQLGEKAEQSYMNNADDAREAMGLGEELEYQSG